MKYESHIMYYFENYCEIQNILSIFIYNIILSHSLLLECIFIIHVFDIMKIYTILHFSDLWAAAFINSFTSSCNEKRANSIAGPVVDTEVAMVNKTRSWCSRSSQHSRKNLTHDKYCKVKVQCVMWKRNGCHKKRINMPGS